MKLIESALAAAQPLPGPSIFQFGGNGITIANLIKNTSTFLMAFLSYAAGVTALLYLLWAGYKLITSGGSPEAVKEARMAIVNVIIGLVLFVSIYAIARFAYALGAYLSN